MGLVAYVDHPDIGRVFTKLGDLVGVFKDFPGAVVSTIVMVGGVEPSEEYFKAWLSVTHNRSIVEDTYAEVLSYLKGVTGPGDLRGLVLRAYENSDNLTDLYALSNALKIFLDINIYDLGLAVLYENPLGVVYGRRISGLGLGRALMRKSHRIGSILVNTALIIQGESRAYVVDWGNPGILPASQAIGDENLSDPAYTALSLGVGLRSRPSSNEVTLIGLRDEGRCVGDVVLVPFSISRNIPVLVDLLKSMGFSVNLSGLNIVDALRCLGIGEGSI